jgi:hypothetical protein
MLFVLVEVALEVINGPLAVAVAVDWGGKTIFLSTLDPHIL